MSANIYHPSRGGVRGGKDQFNWDDVKEDKDRENYLGHSVKAPVGRWQKGKDLMWYTRDKMGDETAEERKRKELKSVKELEAQAMATALGYKLPPQAGTKVNDQHSQENKDEEQTTQTMKEQKQKSSRKKDKSKKKKKKQKRKYESHESEDSDDQTVITRKSRKFDRDGSDSYDNKHIKSRRERSRQIEPYRHRNRDSDESDSGEYRHRRIYERRDQRTGNGGRERGHRR